MPLMKVEPGELDITLERATELKDKRWFGKQSPYCIISCGPHMLKSKVAKSGGENPFWHQQFTFSLDRETDLTVAVKNNGDTNGNAAVPLGRVRETGHDMQEVPVMSDSGKQRGTLYVSLKFRKND